MHGIWTLEVGHERTAVFVCARQFGLDSDQRRRPYGPIKDGRKPAKFIGPGQYMLLVTQDARAIFAWRKFISADGQQGVNCAIFRNEGSECGMLSSELIREAMRLAWIRWLGERLFTYVNPRGVRHKRDPGRCFVKAGWRQCGTTKARKLIIFEALP